MIDLLEKKINLYSSELKTSLRELSILLSFSGGIDSTVLASLLIELRAKHAFELYLIHFNHNIHNKSEQMEQFCQSFAHENNVDYFIRNFSFKKMVNFEACARVKRYSEIDNLAKKLNIPIVFTAHHLDDQIETLYMKMLDKSDWISQIGIRHSLGKIRRPLLDVRKEIIRKHANNKKIKWIQDPTNDNNSIRRNYVRNILLPNVFKNFPEKINKLLDNASLYQLRMNIKISNFNNNKEEFIKYESNEYISIITDKIKNYEIEYLKIFIYWCNSKYFKIKLPEMSRKFWIAFSNYLKQSCTGSKFHIGTLTSIINRDEILLIPSYANLFSKPDKAKLIHNKKWYKSYFNIIENHNTIYSVKKNQFSISRDLFKIGLYMRRWKEGDKIISAGSKKHILISDLFINNKLSIIGKLIHPIIVDQTDRILWVPNMAYGVLPDQPITQKMKVIEWIQA